MDREEGASEHTDGLWNFGRKYDEDEVRGEKTERSSTLLLRGGGDDDGRE
jgi:hypothetical protein